MLNTILRDLVISSRCNVQNGLSFIANDVDLFQPISLSYCLLSHTCPGKVYGNDWQKFNSSDFVKLMKDCRTKLNALIVQKMK